MSQSGILARTLSGLATGAEVLTSLVAGMREAGIEVKLARVHRTIYEALDGGELIEVIGADSFHATPEEALPPTA